MTKRLIIIYSSLFIAAVLVLLLIWPKGPITAPYNSQNLVEDFYKSYLKREKNDNNVDFLNKYLTEDLTERIINSLNREKQSDYDQILCSNSTKEIKISFFTKENNEVIVKENFDGEEKEIIVKLILDNGEYKINEIVCPTISSKRVKIFFANSKINQNRKDCRRVYQVERMVNNDDSVEKMTLKELFKGPTVEEADNGYYSWFSQATADILRDFEIKNETAYVYLKNIRLIIPNININATCDSAQFLSEIGNTLKQFSIVKKVVISIWGNPELFYEWSQTECVDDSCDQAAIDNGNQYDFCGLSTYDKCDSNKDCAPGGCSGQICLSKKQESLITTCEWKDCYQAEKYGLTCRCFNKQCQWIK